MTPDPPGEGGVHDGLRGGADRDRLLEIILSALPTPQNDDKDG